MSYEDTIVETWKNHYLFSALVELTYRCNLDCYFCYNDLGLHGEPLGFGDYERVFAELRSLGCLHLALSGGEPLAHPDFFAIGAKARELGFVVRVKSNGHGLGGETLRRVKMEVDPFVIEVSLHGACQKTHDRQTRIRGSFDRLMRNLKEMREQSMRVKLNATLTKWNEDEIEGMFEIADELALPLTIDPEVTPRDNGDRAVLDISASPAGLKRLMAVQALRRAGDRAEIRRDGDRDASTPTTDRHCGAGASGLAIDPYGNVYPCVQWRRAIGNVHQRTLTDIWCANERVDDIRRVTVDAKRIAEDHGSTLTGFCPGIAEMLTGDPLTIPDSTATRSRILSELPLHPLP